MAFFVGWLYCKGDMMMKSAILIMVLLLVSVVTAGYDYVVESGDDLDRISVNADESLLMTGGQVTRINSDDKCTMRIEGTDPLISEGNGGIWVLGFHGGGSLEILGGEIHEVSIGPTEGPVTISRCRIDIISSFIGPGAGKSVEFICRDWDYDFDTYKLTGKWDDYSTFDIRLWNVGGMQPVIEAINFTIVPEPITLAMLAIGGLMTLRKK